MTTITTGAANLPAQAHRQQTALMLSPDPTNPLAVMDGVHSGLSLTKSTGMGFKVGPGRAAVNGLTPADGPFTVTILSSETGAFDPGDATRDRIDVVSIKTYPAADASAGATIEVIKGSPAASPTVPSTPAGSLMLYQVLIPAGTSAGNGGWATNKVTDRRRKVGMQDFISYTPNFSGFMNLGTDALREGRYRVDGDKVTVNVHLRGGKGGLLGNAGLQAFSLPLPTDSSKGWVYYGNGGLHHPNRSGAAYDLRVMAVDSSAIIFAATSGGGLTAPGNQLYPYGEGTELYMTVEYIANLLD